MSEKVAIQCRRPHKTPRVFPVPLYNDHLNWQPFVSYSRLCPIAWAILQLEASTTAEYFSMQLSSIKQAKINKLSKNLWDADGVVLHTDQVRRGVWSLSYIRMFLLMFWPPKWTANHDHGESRFFDKKVRCRFRNPNPAWSLVVLVSVEVERCFLPCIPG